MEFPRLVHKGSEKLRVNTKAEFDKALKDGFKEHADPPAGSPAAEAAKSAPVADPLRRGPGRPPKAEE